MLYIAIIIYILLLINRYDAKQLTGGDRHYYALFILLTGMAALSYRMGIDPIRYEYYFDNNYQHLNLKTLFSDYDSSSSSEPIWKLVNYFWYVTTHNFQWVKATVAVFVNSVVFWFIKKHSPVKFTSILIYVLLIYVSYSFEVFREAISVSFFLIAYDKLCSGKGYKSYYLWIIPALFCHRFAFITLFFPFVSKIRYNRGFIIVVLGAIILSPILFKVLDSVVSMNILNMVISGRIEGLAESETYGMTHRNIFGFIEMCLYTIIPLLILLRSSDDDNFKSCSLLYIIVFILKSTSFVILYRINNYLAIPLIVALSTGINNSIYKRDSFRVPTLLNSRAISTICVAIYLGFIVKNFVSSETFCLYHPYHSIITKEIDMERESKINELAPYFF